LRVGVRDLKFGNFASLMRIAKHVGTCLKSVQTVDGWQSSRY
jgi:hypothetical protein